MAKRNLIDSFMAEVTMFGGLPMTRATVHRIMTEDGQDKRAVDMFAFSKPAVTAEPISYDEFRAIEASFDAR
jgi:hypothetical protein